MDEKTEQLGACELIDFLTDAWEFSKLPQRTLRDLRNEHGFIQKQVAERMGRSTPRVSEIEKAGFDQRIKSIKSHIEALGGQLHLVAEFRGEHKLITEIVPEPRVS